MMLSTDPEAAKRMRPLYVELLKTFEVPNIDEILMTADEIDQLIASQQAQQQQMLEQGAGAEQQQPPPDNVRPMVAA